jgi:hypothetical protein
MSNMEAMTNEQYDKWLREHTTHTGVSEEERLVDMISRAVREVNKQSRAQLLIDTANLCMVMVDKSLGCHVSVATCVTLTRH